MEDATTGLRLHPEAMAVQGVVLVVLDVNKDICMQALNWALGHVARKGDALRLVGVLSHVLNPMGYKCRLDENSWLGANRRILENELITKQHMLANIEDLDRCCERAGVTVTVEVKAGLHPKMIVVEEAKKHGAYHVVLDRNMKKDRKYFIDNLTCFVTRVRNSGGVDSVRSFAISKPLMPVVPSSNISFRSTNFPAQFATAPGGGLSNQSSFNSSLRGSSLSSTTYNQDTHEFLPHQLWKQDSMGSSGASRRSSCEELFSLNPETGPPPVSEPSTTATEAAFEISRKRPVAQHSQELWPKAPRPDVHDLTLSLHHSGSLPDSSRALSLPVSRALVTSRTNAFFSRSISAVSADRVASGRIGVREKASKSVWLWTSSKEVMTSALENGWTTFIFTADTKDLADDWTMVARIRPLLLEGDQFVDTQNRQVAALTNYSSGEPLDNLMGRVETVIVNGLESEVTAAERIVTAFQGCSTSLYAVANSASEAQLYVEALGKGTDGIVLQTEDPSQVYALKAYLRGRREATMGVRLVTATVTLVEPVGLGDRVCVDLCNLLHPGEGLLVGSFARALFLVHSEWSDIDQTSSRPFRVNAGPVHAYVGMAGGVTSYLSELHTGSQVMVVDAQGRTRTVLVGRVKIEQRPLLLVEVEVEGQRHSVLLQNCDSVCLVSPGDGMNGNAIPVTSLKRGHSLLLNMQDEERETGIETQRRAVEK
jgi:3-dehydroquinate synthase class II